MFYKNKNSKKECGHDLQVIISYGNISINMDMSLPSAMCGPNIMNLGCC